MLVFKTLAVPFGPALPASSPASSPACPVALPATPISAPGAGRVPALRVVWTEILGTAGPHRRGLAGAKGQRGSLKQCLFPKGSSGGLESVESPGRLWREGEPLRAAPHGAVPRAVLRILPAIPTPFLSPRDIAAPCRLLRFLKWGPWTRSITSPWARVRTQTLRPCCIRDPGVFEQSAVLLFGELWPQEVEGRGESGELRGKQPTIRHLPQTLPGPPCVRVCLFYEPRRISG